MLAGLCLPGLPTPAGLGLAALLAAALTLGACSGGTGLPDFPKYPPADDFLAMQARTQAYQPPPPPSDYVYGQKNQEIYENLQAQQRLSQAETVQRSRQREEFMRRHRVENQGEWDALQRRLARDEALAALREQERGRNQSANQDVYYQRYQGYNDRLERLAQEQEAMAREQEMNAFRNQQRIQSQLEELKRRQAQNLRIPTQGPGPDAGTSTPPVP